MRRDEGRQNLIQSRDEVQLVMMAAVVCRLPQTKIKSSFPLPLPSTYLA
jgi:CRISPR/Cas system-associated protein Cas5 (RAMP superfamily)